MKRIDLHIHTTCSDGVCTPTQVVHYAFEQGLAMISVTDHDTIDGLEEAIKQGELLGIKIINGVEINSYCELNGRKIDIHVLGYMFDIDKIKPYIEKIKLMRLQHNMAILKALDKINIHLSFAELCGSGSITRLNFAKALVKRGYATSVEDALCKYLHKGGSAFVEYNSQPFCKVASEIHKADGIVSLAHPGEYRLSEKEVKEIIKNLKILGLDAVERHTSVP